MIIIFNKPYGVISQFSEHNIYDSLKDFIPIKNVYPAGRLDADSEGLVILTDNGQFQNRLSSPSKNIEKIYLAQVENIPKMEEIMRLEKGIQISSYVTKKSKVKLIENPEPTSTPLVALILIIAAAISASKRLKTGSPKPIGILVA